MLKGVGPPTLSRARSIVVIRLDELGDLVMNTAVLRGLRSLAPQARITLVVRSELRDLMTLSPHVDQVLGFDRGKARLLRPVSIPIRAWRFATSALRPLHPEVVILPRWGVDTSFATYLAAFTAAPIRIGFSERVDALRGRLNARYDDLLTHLVPSTGVAHESEHGATLLRYLGASGDDPNGELLVNEDNQHAADLLLRESGILDAEKFVAMAPSGGHSPLKEWPAPRFGELARRIWTATGLRSVVLGAPGEERLARAVLDVAKGSAVSLVGKTSLPALAAVLKRSSLYVGNDAGPLHIAAAVGTPVVAIFGSSDPSRFAPRGRSHQLVWLDLPCGPRHTADRIDRCQRCIFDVPRCLHDLAVDKVAAACLLALAPANRASPAGDRLVNLPVHQ